MLIDSCGGGANAPGNFYNTIRDELLSRAFPDNPATDISDASSLLTSSAPGMDDIEKPEFREYVRSLPDSSHFRPQILRSGKGRVLLLPLDLTSGLLDEQAWGIAGYRPDYCLSFLKNVVLWTWDGAKD